MTIVERKRKLQQEALENMGTAQDATKLEEAKTTDIESEEVDIFERKQKFEELLKRMDKHNKENVYLRGNDLRYNTYMRKLQKLTRMDLGLDVEAYKDYINNLKAFAGMNSDFELFARDDLKFDAPEYRQLVEINWDEGTVNGKPLSQEDLARYKVRCEDIQNTLKKLRREASAFLNKRDKENITDFIKNMRHYLKSYELYDTTQALYEKKQREIKER